jgi:hypothetical protein
VWESTVATEGMFGNLNPLGDGPGRSLADHDFFDWWWALFDHRAAENGG